MTNANFPLTAPDIAATPDMDTLASETTSELENLSQDLLHTLAALPGSNLDLPLDRGVGVMQWLNGTSLASLPSAIEQDFGKDPRVQGCIATITKNPTGSAFPFTIQVQIESVSGVFGLSFGWSQQGVQILPPAGS